MRSILKQINSTPSTAIKFALAGLDRLSKKEGYVINMGTFGLGDCTDRVCYGCAATAAVQEMWMEDFIPENINSVLERSGALDLDCYELKSFEAAIDAARRNNLEKLGDFCNYDLGIEEATVDYIIDDWIYDNSIEYFIRVLKLVYAVLISAGK
jgi:hypothetical protein